jgi:hypothetical protein
MTDQEKQTWKIFLADIVIAQANAALGQRILGGSIFAADGCVWVTTEKGETCLSPSFTSQKDLLAASGMNQKGEPLTREEQMALNEPFLKGKNGKLISLAEFERRCYVQRADRKESQYDMKSGELVPVRRYMVLFGRNDQTGTWKYGQRIFTTGNKKEVLQRAFENVKAFAAVEESSFIPSRFKDEVFDHAYNRKVPLSF